MHFLRLHAEQPLTIHPVHQSYERSARAPPTPRTCIPSRYLFPRQKSYSQIPIRPVQPLAACCPIAFAWNPNPMPGYIRIFNPYSFQRMLGNLEGAPRSTVLRPAPVSPPRRRSIRQLTLAPGVEVKSGTTHTNHARIYPQHAPGGCIGVLCAVV